ncbi:hypothetical protein BC792_105110 [Sphingobacterium allocomposti]|uniref:Uncharacterized protein n=1 Tax=Sphingobacterium allocomposti TaxID=415956 RepID=A0A5S5DPJ9_9SPHI|nr:hypothetical protein [Sphingobacterium composti Yoo et al. 2007 non Ten et al. 2007]TYP96619.1 hypothetical protein BC792_105110 [Sphingobacterium composti Yoo et al. 2007 non Ten et al. 2007]
MKKRSVFRVFVRYGFLRLMQAAFLALVFITTAEVYNTLYFTEGDLSAFGAGFLLGNILLCAVASAVSYRLIKSMREKR